MVGARVVQWNFFLLPKISVFGEGGLVLQHYRYDRGIACNQGFCDDGNFTTTRWTLRSPWAAGSWSLIRSVSCCASATRTSRLACRSCCRVVGRPRRAETAARHGTSRSPSTNIAATIFRDLRSQILKGVLKPSERLPGERELAAQYGTIATRCARRCACWSKRAWSPCATAKA